MGMRTEVTQDKEGVGFLIGRPNTGRPMSPKQTYILNCLPSHRREGVPRKVNLPSQNSHALMHVARGERGPPGHCRQPLLLSLPSPRVFSVVWRSLKVR